MKDDSEIVIRSHGSIEDMKAASKPSGGTCILFPIIILCQYNCTHYFTENKTSDYVSGSAPPDSCSAPTDSEDHSGMYTYM